MDVIPVKNGSDKELHRLYDDVTQHYQELKAAKSDSIEMLLTVILLQKLDEKTWLKWVELDNDSENVPRVWNSTIS